ncbi:TPA: hypothetical protein U2D29_002443 [Streptococcus suis]|nr:hypothetical protein [Streptococcus suis]
MIPKFRAWDKIRNRISEVERIYIDTKGVRLRDENGEYWRRFDDVILMQSTGLVDKNGKEIFEGDVFTYLDDDNNPIYENIVVKFGQHTNMDTIYERGPVYIGLYVETQKGTATLEIDSMYNDCEGRLTIIGNIYENPELVEW